MHTVKLLFLITCISFAGLGCKKDTTNTDCEDLKNAIITDNQNDIKAIVTSHINKLPSKNYTEQNINALASSLSGTCSISTLIYCYDCIATLPGMSEIEVKVTSTQPNVKKVLDISYDAANKMTCASVHN
jgi:hypothetical protein